MRPHRAGLFFAPVCAGDRPGTLRSPGRRVLTSPRRQGPLQSSIRRPRSGGPPLLDACGTQRRSSGAERCASTVHIRSRVGPLDPGTDRVAILADAASAAPVGAVMIWSRVSQGALLRARCRPHAPSPPLATRASQLNGVGSPFSGQTTCLAVAVRVGRSGERQAPRPPVSLHRFLYTNTGGGANKGPGRLQGRAHWPQSVTSLVGLGCGSVRVRPATSTKDVPGGDGVCHEDAALAAHAVAAASSRVAGPATSHPHDRHASGGMSVAHKPGSREDVHQRCAKQRQAARERQLLAGVRRRSVAASLCATTVAALGLRGGRLGRRNL